MSFDDHQEIVEIVGDAPRQASHCLHFLRLAKLLFEKLTFANILGHHQADSPPRVFQFVRNSFDLNHLAIFLAMLPMAMIMAFVRNLLQLFKISCSFLLWAKVENAHSLEFIQRISILLDGRIVHFQEPPRFFVDDPGGERIVAEKQPEHLFVLAKRLFRATPFNGESDVTADGAEELQIANVVRIFAMVMLDNEDADGRCRCFEGNAEPRRRRRPNKLDFTFGCKPVEFVLRNQHR